MSLDIHNKVSSPEPHGDTPNSDEIPQSPNKIQKGLANNAECLVILPKSKLLSGFLQSRPSTSSTNPTKNDLHKLLPSNRPGRTSGPEVIVDYNEVPELRQHLKSEPNPSFEIVSQEPLSVQTPGPSSVLSYDSAYATPSCLSVAYTPSTPHTPNKHSLQTDFKPKLPDVDLLPRLEDSRVCKYGNSF